MRTIILACFFFLASFSFVSAQDVPEVQKTMITKITATWCPNCGSWGWDFFEDIINASTLQKAIFVGAHHSGSLGSDAGEAFSINFNAPYQPYFYAGNMDLGVNSGNVSAKVTETEELINQNAENTPVANVGFAATLSDNTLIVNTNTKFFQDASGDYYLALYILEHNVIASQSNNSSSAQHPYVLRSSFTTDNFGVSIVNGDITAGTEFTDASYTIELNSNWDLNKVSVMGVLWEKVDDTYEFVNVNSTNEFSTVAVQTISEDVAKVNLTPTVTNSQTQLSVQLEEATLDAEIAVYNLNGQQLQTVFEGTLTQGLQNFDINTSDLAAGKYFVTLRSNDGRVITKPFVVTK